MFSVRRMVIIGLLAALSLSIFLLEGAVSPAFPVPGAKIGLANAVTVAALYLLPRERDALCVLLARIVLAAAFGGGPMVLTYSLCGGLMSFAAMIALKRAGYFSLQGVSAAGGFFHNLGQMLAAVWITKSSGLWFYFPLLAGLGIFSGFVTGFLAARTLKKLPARFRSLFFDDFA